MRNPSIDLNAREPQDLENPVMASPVIVMTQEQRARLLLDLLEQNLVTKQQCLDLLCPKPTAEPVDILKEMLTEGK